MFLLMIYMVGCLKWRNNLVSCTWELEWIKCIVLPSDDDDVICGMHH